MSTLQDPRRLMEAIAPAENCNRLPMISKIPVQEPLSVPIVYGGAACASPEHVSESGLYNGIDGWERVKPNHYGHSRTCVPKISPTPRSWIFPWCLRSPVRSPTRLAESVFLDPHVPAPSWFSRAAFGWRSQPRRLAARPAIPFPEAGNLPFLLVALREQRYL